MMIHVSLISIPWNGGEIVAGAGRVGSRSGRELPGLCSGLLGRCPASACFLTEGVDCSVEGREEVVWIEGADEFVALELRSDRVLEFGEHEGGAVGALCAREPDLRNRRGRLCRPHQVRRDRRDQGDEDGEDGQPGPDPTQVGPK